MLTNLHQHHQTNSCCLERLRGNYRFAAVTSRDGQQARVGQIPLQSIDNRDDRACCQNKSWRKGGDLCSPNRYFLDLLLNQPAYQHHLKLHESWSCSSTSCAMGEVCTLSIHTKVSPFNTGPSLDRDTACSGDYSLVGHEERGYVGQTQQILQNTRWLGKDVARVRA